MIGTIPTARQIAYQRWERGLFLHFGLRTFYEGWKDMDPRPMDPARFQPTALDCDQWARTAVAAGFRYMVMTAKHHDGFALWPSATTRFSVASSPWKAGQGDVVREFLDACRRHGLATGLYYSPYDHTCPVYADPRAYDDYFVNQISELLQPYGPIDMLWFDGCGSEHHTYDWPRIIAAIRRMQPNLLLFNMGDPDFRWIGNEAGLAPMDNHNVVDWVPFSVNADELEGVARRWLPGECDCMLRDRNWFYSDQDEHTVKGLDELLGLYDYSCGRGANLLINVGPDRRGLLPEADASRLVAFGRAIAQRTSEALATIADATRQGAAWVCESTEPYWLVDQVVLGEDIARGEHIHAFTIWIETWIGHRPIAVYRGLTVGYRAICRFPLVRTHRLWVEVTEAHGEINLERFDLYGLAR